MRVSTSCRPDRFRSLALAVKVSGLAVASSYGTARDTRLHWDHVRQQSAIAAVRRSYALDMPSRCTRPISAGGAPMLAIPSLGRVTDLRNSSPEGLLRTTPRAGDRHVVSGRNPRRRPGVICPRQVNYPDFEQPRPRYGSVEGLESSASPRSVVSHRFLSLNAECS
jgi:hypothetical protein